MRILVFDTETNGLPPSYPKHISEQPFMVQMACILFEDERPVGHFSSFCVPEDENGKRHFIPKEDFFIEHGLTDEVINSVGQSYKVVVPVVNNLIKRCDFMVAHNAPFDDQIVKAAYWRANFDTKLWSSKPLICTCRMLENVLKLPPPSWKKTGYKFPNLDEAYRALVHPEGFVGAHDAMNDVMACAKVFFAARKKEIPSLFIRGEPE